ncbi:AAA family ATPase [Paracidovorax oryzae]|uniref:AAA family ATPase n=1 Tax=Paracidovorax oryzae TaxID=862720 RepID=UPI0035CFC886
MKVTRVEARHCFSLEDVGVDLSPGVTVLVGPNATGKTNFVRTLEFLRDAVRDGLDHAVAARGGIGRLRQHSGEADIPGLVEIGIHATQSFRKNANRLAHYVLKIDSAADGNYRVASEDATYHHEELFPQDDSQQVWDWEVYELGFTRDGVGKVLRKNISPNTPFTIEDQQRLALGALLEETRMVGLDELGKPLERHILRWRFSSLYPNILRQVTTLHADTSLREDGSNWVSVIRSAQRTEKGRQMLERIYEMMCVVLPDFRDVAVTPVGSYLIPFFRFGKNGETERQFDPAQLSDGTLRVFGILLSLYQTPTPSLIVIEEPEQTVHPAVLSMLAEAFKEVAELTQIVVTTHSPQLIEHFEPDNIRIVTMQDGVTHIAPIKASQREAVQRGLMTLGEFMAAEGLQPEEAP